MSQAQLDARHREFQLGLVNAVPEMLEAFSPPLLIKIPTEWEVVEHRILWIGQETAGWSWKVARLRADDLGWDYPDITSLGDFARHAEAVEALTYGYGEFNLAVNHPANRGLYWRYFRWMFDAMLAHGRTSMVWTNVIRCSANAGKGYTPWDVSEPIRSAFLAQQHRLLAAEIEVLRPTLVIFVSGPDYEIFVRQEFQGCESVALAPFTIRQAARFSHAALPPSSFRTYHPGHLNCNELGSNPI